MEVVDRAPGDGGRHLPHQVALQRLRGHGLGLPHGVPGQALLPSPTLVHKGLGNCGDRRENFDLPKIILSEKKQEIVTYVCDIINLPLTEIWDLALLLHFLEPEQDPGPNSVRRTGNRRRLWRSPRTMTRMIILVKVMMT